MRCWVSARSFCSSTALSTGESTGGDGSGVTRGAGGVGAAGRGAGGTLGRRGSGAGGTALGGLTGAGDVCLSPGSSGCSAGTEGTARAAAGAACTSSGGVDANQLLIVAQPVRPR